MSGGLKIRTEDAEDLRVIAAHLQDALVPLDDMEDGAADKHCVMVANRFRWENCADGADMLPPSSEPVPDPALAPHCISYERVNCAITFENILAVKRRNLEMRERGRILELLTMEIEGDTGGK